MKLLKIANILYSVFEIFPEKIFNLPFVLHTDTFTLLFCDRKFVNKMLTRSIFMSFKRIVLTAHSCYDTSWKGRFKQLSKYCI